MWNATVDSNDQIPQFFIWKLKLWPQGGRSIPGEANYAFFFSTRTAEIERNGSTVA